MQSTNPGFMNELVAVLRSGQLDSGKSKKSYSKMDLAKLKVKLCAKHKVKSIPTDIEILMNLSTKDLKDLKHILISKPTRSISGVAVVAIMCKPHKCPHGKCSICPGGIESEFGDVPQSYTGKEPATMRALRNNFDPYLQVFNRLEQYVVSGHVPDKVELIIMGGTFPSLSKKYQTEFIRLALKAMNDFSELFFKKGDVDISRFKSFFELPGKVADKKRTDSIKKKILELKKNPANKDLLFEQKKNESSRIKCVGMTLETRPDYGRTKQGNFALSLGATRIELGIESVYDSVLKKIDRGHDIKESLDSIQELKDLGFKLNFHYMLGLPGTTKSQDLKGLIELFKNPDFRPDMLKIYPCMVMKGTKLYSEFNKKTYEPLSTQAAAEIISEFKKHVPKYVRIMRIQRDIPTHQTVAGVDRTNLRQYVADICTKKSIVCNCIRCREAGRAKNIANISITTEEYTSSGGKEFFISAEDKKNNAIIGFVRLRFPSKELRKEITKDSAIIRELHVYGETAAIGENTKNSKKHQHKGYGRRLMKMAEDIARKHNKTKLLVISGIGVRNYYRKLGYRKQGPYMVKNI